jgi:hypothetical protein
MLTYHSLDQQQFRGLTLWRMYIASVEVARENIRFLIAMGLWTIKIVRHLP